ncbi:hypothetical protein [Haloferula sp. A504]|uniref:hypothetical protein n=1 Tax=Haloferula sp. A504 TaxID=3373601 RepID=UPI0031C6E844|nr:hypothetical protein [Verrucomicrobiaceae bacterium E54]
MKTIINTVLLLLTAFLLSSCDESSGGAPPPPRSPGASPVSVIEDRVKAERQLRQQAEAKVEEAKAEVQEAEAKVEKATMGKGRWQLAALGLAFVTVIAFVGGTAIGSSSRGESSHASATS